MPAPSLPAEVHSKIIRHLHDSVYPALAPLLPLTFVSHFMHSLVQAEIYSTVEIYGIRPLLHFITLLRSSAGTSVVEKVNRVRTFLDSREEAKGGTWAKGPKAGKLVEIVNRLERLQDLEIYLHDTGDLTPLKIQFEEGPRSNLTKLVFVLPPLSTGSEASWIFPHLHETENLRDLHLENVGFSLFPTTPPKWKLRRLTLIIPQPVCPPDRTISGILESWFRSSFASMEYICLSRVPFKSDERQYWAFLRRFSAAKIHIWNAEMSNPIAKSEDVDAIFEGQNVVGLTDHSSHIQPSEHTTSLTDRITQATGLRVLSEGNLKLLPLASEAGAELEWLRLEMFMFRTMPSWLHDGSFHSLRSLSLSFARPDPLFSPQNTKKLIHIFRDSLERLDIHQLADSSVGASHFYGGFFEFHLLKKVKAFQFTSSVFAGHPSTSLFPPNVQLLFLTISRGENVPGLAQIMDRDHGLRNLKAILIKPVVVGLVFQGRAFPGQRISTMEAPPPRVGGMLQPVRQAMAIERIGGRDEKHVEELKAFATLKAEGRAAGVVVKTNCDTWTWQCWCDRILNEAE
ncbi:hypothetical protein BT69DRAFT_222659 [Atractiella rhizophila]|nr:hypothetical protein BT69DRAFT_222659 [Atractiella rhizophila]